MFPQKHYYVPNETLRCFFGYIAVFFIGNQICKFYYLTIELLLPIL